MKKLIFAAAIAVSSIGASKAITDSDGVELDVVNLKPGFVCLGKKQLSIVEAAEEARIQSAAGQFAAAAELYEAVVNAGSQDVKAFLLDDLGLPKDCSREDIAFALAKFYKDDC